MEKRKNPDGVWSGKKGCGGENVRMRREVWMDGGRKEAKKRKKEEKRQQRQQRHRVMRTSNQATKQAGKQIARLTVKTEYAECGGEPDSLLAQGRGSGPATRAWVAQGTMSGNPQLG
ncbi:hypothetical protein BO86DRAFT_380902 [Aspergillus japonicus CBS 114.51]|uniref:Uncharacterized protein n=2 Tax=Aspergillus TaxID=5052 RepID=A0A2V5HLW9_ASPV1|nr:hypothetical protein BO86DRAFT_380902 [Aspergillus japonicus CBS 114.51]PYI17190.1 hypothetical protein BO99DRAFT_475171 [Aspergillus violaceofuscus CBS 115571]RAH79907.1 hypothetical protein BO86DRAFT_380902 [Aspergillus japonicus CBS 114.51]